MIMLRLTAILAATLASLSMAPAATHTFAANGDPLDYFLPRPPERFLKINAEGDLVFQTSGGGFTSGFAPEREQISSLADDVEVTFQTSGSVTLAIFLRAQGDGNASYMAFVGKASDDSYRLYLCKTTFVGAQYPGASNLVFKVLPDYRDGEWYKLQVHLKNQGSGVALTAQVAEVQTSHVLAEIGAQDTNSPILEAGLVGLRFAANKAGGGGSVWIREISVAP